MTSLSMENLPVSMIRPDLAAVPQHPLPAGFAVRTYQPGDRETWLTIERAAEPFHAITGPLYDNEFGAQEDLRAQRQLFLVNPDGQGIGTATAWLNGDYRGQPFGRVHWVAIVPAYQGRGLSRPLMTAVCNRLRELGHVRAYLGTSTGRRPAIRLYLSFGFQPEIRDDEDRRRWAPVLSALRSR